MAVRHHYFSAAGITGFQAMRLSEAMTQASVQVGIVCTGHSLAIGDTLDIDAGWADDHDVLVAAAVVKNISVNWPTGLYTITLQDSLIRAVDNFLASDDPDSPFMADNISGEALVGDLLSASGLTSYTSDATGMTFATQAPAPINLISAWDAINNIAKIAGFTTWVDNTGLVHFEERKPYIGGGDSSGFSIVGGSGGTLSRITYAESDQSLRNRIVVYGANGIHSTASAVSPYLPNSPVNFYKTLSIGHELIDSQMQADATAAVNLAMFNRLDRKAQVSVIGTPSLRARGIVDVTDSYCGLAADLFIINGCTHSIGPDGYAVELTLTR